MEKNERNWLNNVWTKFERTDFCYINMTLHIRIFNISYEIFRSLSEMNEIGQKYIKLLIYRSNKKRWLWKWSGKSGAESEKKNWMDKTMSNQRKSPTIESIFYTKRTMTKADAFRQTNKKTPTKTTSGGDWNESILWLIEIGHFGVRKQTRALLVKHRLGHGYNQQQHQKNQDLY